MSGKPKKKPSTPATDPKKGSCQGSSCSKDNTAKDAKKRSKPKKLPVGSHEEE